MVTFIFINNEILKYFIIILYSFKNCQQKKLKNVEQESSKFILLILSYSYDYYDIKFSNVLFKDYIQNTKKLKIILYNV